MDSESAEPSPTTDEATFPEADARPVGVFPPPRKLTTEQERELTRQYAETSTPIADIARTFSISEVSVGRIAQRNGATSRRRRAARDTTPDAPTVPSSARRGRRRRADAEAESTEETGAGRRGRQRRADDGSQPRTRGRRQSVSAAAAATAPGASPPAPASAQESARGGARRRFRIRFFAETVVEADNVRDALGQAEALGATDITGIVQESG